MKTFLQSNFSKYNAFLYVICTNFMDTLIQRVQFLDALLGGLHCKIQSTNFEGWLPFRSQTVAEHVN